MNDLNVGPIAPIIDCVGLEVVVKDEKFIYRFSKSVTDVVANYIKVNIANLTIEKIKSGKNSKDREWHYVQLLIDGVVIDKGYLNNVS